MAPVVGPVQVRAASMSMGRRLRDVGMLGGIVILGLLANDWIASLGLAMLFVGWKYLAREQGPPIVAAAFSSQWLQIMAGVLYAALTGRRIMEMRMSDYRPMVLLGLGCITVLFSGFYFGARFRRIKRFSESTQRLLPWSTYQLAVMYMTTVALGGILQELAWSTAGMTQIILVFSRIRYVFLFFLVTRLAQPNPRWPLIGAILFAELLLGFGGFFADFREPLVIVAIAILGATSRRTARTWILVISLGVLGITSAVIWTGIKPIIRQNYMAGLSTPERLNAVLTLTGSVFGSGGPIWKYQTDNMVARIWAVYFPALALKRVPSIVPHENGTIVRKAIENALTPRLFFPNKRALPSQSEEVRKYSGVWVAGRETNTSYAFGYAAESYVDFGVPLMFVPVFAFGLLLGLAYRFLNTHVKHDELRIGVTIVIVWSTLSAYEASWVMMIGPALTVLLVLGGGAVLLDRMLRATTRAGLRPVSTPTVRSWAART